MLSTTFLSRPWDLLRLADLALWAVNFGFAFGTMAYYQLARAMRPYAPGIIPRYVITIAMSYLAATGWLAYSCVDNFGEGFRWPAVLATFSFSLGSWALWQVMKYENRRFHPTPRLGFEDPDRRF
jgi:hypothetical protein